MKIGNEFYSAEANERGEITSFKLGGKEYIWNASPEFWAYSAPALFPYVGKIKDGKTLIGGEEFVQTTRHGFGRNIPYILRKVNENALVMTAESDEQTLARYPFKFRLDIGLKVAESGFVMTYTVTNCGEGNMPFCIGSHPAFMLPGEIEECCLKAEAVANMPYFAQDEKGLYHGDEIFGVMEGSELPFSMELFEKDGVVFPTVEGNRVFSVINKNTGEGFSLAFPDFPNCVVWIPAGKRAPFVCVEPCCGMSDDYNGDGVFENKNYVQVLAEGESKSFTFAFKPIVK